MLRLPHCSPVHAEQHRACCPYLPPPALGQAQQERPRLHTPLLSAQTSRQAQVQRVHLIPPQSHVFCVNLPGPGARGQGCATHAPHGRCRPPSAATRARPHRHPLGGLQWSAASQGPSPGWEQTQSERACASPAGHRRWVQVVRGHRRWVQVVKVAQQYNERGMSHWCA